VEEEGQGVQGQNRRTHQGSHTSRFLNQPTKDPDLYYEKPSPQLRAKSKANRARAGTYSMIQEDSEEGEDDIG
jgi:hypothetical protein